MAYTKLTASSLGTFRACVRMYFFKYVEGRVSTKERLALSFGKIAHRGLAAWWEEGLEGAVRELVDCAKDMDEGEASKLAAMMQFYDPPRDKYKLLASEDEFEVLIVNPETGRSMRGYSLGGKIDKLVENEAGEKWVLEHKTTSDEIMGFGPYWQRLAIDHQVSYYVLATGAVGCLYDVLRKPGIKLCGKDVKAAEKAGICPGDAYQARVEEQIGSDLEKYYQFRKIHKSAEDITEAQTDLWQQAHLLAECRKRNMWPRNSGACRGFFGTCDYLEVCTGQADLSDDGLFRTKERENEELEKQ